jgi:hypothetical protein
MTSSLQNHGVIIALSIANWNYTVTLEADAAGQAVTALRWEKTPVPGTMLTDPGVYCLRSNELSWDAERCGVPT